MQFADTGFYQPLTDANGIGDKKAKLVVQGVQKNRSLINFLMDELHIISGRNTRMYQTRFKACFTKIRSKEITSLIESKGGTVVDNLTKDTDFLIVPSINTSSTTVEKAIRYEIPIIPIDDVEKYILKTYR